MDFPNKRLFLGWCILFHFNALGFVEYIKANEEDLVFRFFKANRRL